MALHLTKTKYIKDSTCAIFLMSRWFKDIKYDIHRPDDYGADDYVDDEYDNDDYDDFDDHFSHFIPFVPFKILMKILGFPEFQEIPLLGPTCQVHLVLF